MIPISSLPYKKDCFYKDSLFDLNRIEYDVFYSDHLIEDYFPFFVFHKTLFGIVNRLENDKEIRIDNLEERIYNDLNVYFFKKDLTKNISDIRRIENISRQIFSEIISIINLMNEAVIVNNNSKVNFVLKTIGSHTYSHTYIDLSFFTKDEKLVMYLFQPLKGYTVFNIKTALSYFFWEEISKVDELIVYTLGTFIDKNVLLDKVVSFKKNNISLESSNLKRLESINLNYKKLLIQKEPFFISCNDCFMPSCSHKP